MAKKKASNPVDAARKAARARELKKNKAEREKVREVVTVRKDTKGLEADIRRLESKERAGTATKSDKSDLTDLKAEFSRITDAKEAYVAAHPEHRKYVYGKEVPQGGSETVFGDGKKKAISNLNQAGAAGSVPQGQNATMAGMGGRDPKRSVYYHEIFNPLGAPPPGMPYLEKPPDRWDPPFGIPRYTGPPPSLDSAPPAIAEGSASATTSQRRQDQEETVGRDQEDAVDDEEDDEAEEDDEDDEDEDQITLPTGPAPPLPDLPSLPEGDAGGGQDNDSDSDSDIVMPEGPPPLPREEEDDFQPPMPPIPTGPKSNVQPAPPLPPPPLPSGPPPTQLQPAPGFYSGPPPPLPFSHPPPPLPPNHQYQGPPPPLPPRYGPGYGPPPSNSGGDFNHRGGPHANNGFDRGRGRGRGNFVPQNQRNPRYQQEVLDPLSADGKSHETFASHAHKMREKSRAEAAANATAQGPSGASSLPAKPNAPGPSNISEPTSNASAIISAEPQLRDLKKEVTAFLPPAMRKRLQKEKERKEMGLPNLNTLTSAPREEDFGNGAAGGYLEGWDDDDGGSGGKSTGNRGLSRPESSASEGGDRSRSEKPSLLNALKGQLEHPSKMGQRVNAGSSIPAKAGIPTGEAGKKRKNDDYDKFLNEMGDLL